MTTTGDHDSTAARAEILRRTSEAINGIQRIPTVERRYLRTSPSGTDVIALFAERVADYKARVSQVRQDELAAAIDASLRRRGANRVAIPPGLPPAWLAASSAEWFGDEPPLSHTDLDQLDGVLTGCAVGIAETGTIVLDAGPGQGRRALSLLPDYHLCVVMSEQIVGSVPEAIERLDPRRPQTWISGPSATSDIELDRVEGVHGPRNLEVLVVAD